MTFTLRTLSIWAVGCLTVSALALIPHVSTVVGQTIAPQFPGGFVETMASATRPRWSASQIQSFLPSGRGKFTFPSPYRTEGVRITNSTDCGGSDCVKYVGYAYWRNMNNHVGSNEILVFLGLTKSRGGSGPTLFRYNKTTDQVTKVAPLFDSSHALSNASGEGWYFSASLPTKLYLNQGSRMYRYDVISKQFETVFDVAPQYGSDKYIWQMHSSNDDLVHTATLRSTSNGAMLGCVIYREATKQFLFYTRLGTFDECHIDKSGRYLMILDNTDGQYDVENRFIDLQTGAETRILDQNGAVAHSDMGYGYVVGADNWNPLPNAAVTYTFSPTVTKGPAVFYNVNWNLNQVNHVSHQNAKPGPMNQQYACGSNADSGSVQNEIICFRLDNTRQQLVVAPVMTIMSASGGGDSYSKMPKGNLDVTGNYFIWTTNMGGSRLDAFIVKVPAHLLMGGQTDTTPPSAPSNVRIM